MFDEKLTPKQADRRLGFNAGIAWIREQADHCGLGHQLVQQAKSLRGDGSGEKTYPSDIATRSVEVSDHAELNRIACYSEDNWDRRCSRFGCQGRIITGCPDHIHMTVHQIG